MTNIQHHTTYEILQVLRRQTETSLHTVQLKKRTTLK